MAELKSSNPQREEHPSHLEPSELGTKEYWETFYETSLSHLSSKKKGVPRDDGGAKAEEDDEDEDSEDEDDDDDPGTSWFTEHNAPEKVLQFLTSEEFPLAPENYPSQSQLQSQSPQTHPRILDLGTGNGSMLAILRNKGGYRGQMVGVDYSGKSVELARKLWEGISTEEEKEGIAGESRAGDDSQIRFEEWDILAASPSSFSPSPSSTENGMPDWFPREQGGFDIVLDKGTFDAVSLSDEVVTKTGKGETETKASKIIQQRICERYPGIARRLVRKGGFLVVTSCNWTEEELVRWFTGPDEVDENEDANEDRLVVWDRIEYPRFRFGGQEGQGVSTVCFKRKGGL